MKELRKVENFEEFKKIWIENHPYHYYGNRSITEEKKKELEEKYYNKEFKKYDIYFTLDNNILEFENEDTISNDIYYDDETEDPGKDFETFLDYNLKMNFRDHGAEYWAEQKERLNTVGCCSGRIEDVPLLMRLTSKDGDKRAYVSFVESWGRSGRNEANFLRELTEAEISDIMEIETLRKANYINRLAKYYKRYCDKIYTVGYWANR